MSQSQQSLGLPDEVIDHIFDRCEDVHIELDPEPIQRGPHYLNEMVAECRNYTTEFQKYKQLTIREKSKIERHLNRKKSEKELRFNDLMSNDERVTSKSSRADREAMANRILQDLNSQINDLESNLTDLKHVESVLESKLRELRDVNRDIRLQKKLIEDEIETGAFWGDDFRDEGEDIDTETADFDMSELLDDQNTIEDDDEPSNSVENDMPNDTDDEFEDAIDRMETEPSQDPMSSGDDHSLQTEEGGEVDFGFLDDM